MLQFDWIRALVRWISLSLQLRGNLRPFEPTTGFAIVCRFAAFIGPTRFHAPETQTPLEFADSAGLQPELAPPVREFTQLYSQARFGNTPCDAAACAHCSPRSVQLLNLAKAESTRIFRRRTVVSFDEEKRTMCEHHNNKNVIKPVDDNFSQVGKQAYLWSDCRPRR